MINVPIWLFVIMCTLLSPYGLFLVGFIVHIIASLVSKENSNNEN